MDYRKTIFTIGLTVLFFSVILLSLIIVFRNEKTVTYTYQDKPDITDTLSSKINLL